MGFHAQVSDPRMGGTYMTLMNTVTNLGSKWPGTLALWLVDVVSLKGCEGVSDRSLDCDTLTEVQVQWTPLSMCSTHSLFCVPAFRRARLLGAIVSHMLTASTLKRWLVLL